MPRNSGRWLGLACTSSAALEEAALLARAGAEPQSPWLPVLPIWLLVVVRRSTRPPGPTSR
eukprot:1475431-Prymnesium_polylepis.1